MKVDVAPLGHALVGAGRRATSMLPGRWGRHVRESAKWAVDYNGARKTGLRGWRFSRLGRHSGLLLAPFGSGRLLVDTRDEEIGRVVFMRGDYERHYMNVALDCLRESTGFTPSERTLIDVGANIGTTTIDALVHFGFARVSCFEPDQRNVRLLRMNLVLNDLTDRATVHAMAASDRDGHMTVQQRPDNFGDSRVVFGSTLVAGSEIVRSVRLDSLVADGSIDLDQVGLMWVDAQGHEPHVLNGAQMIVGAGIPVVVEYWPDGLGTGDERTLFESIVAANYKRVIDLRVACSGRRPAEFPAVDITDLRKRYGRAQHTDLLLLR